MPELHLMCGLPGAGKTTLAKQLERDLPALRLCPDEWLARLIGGDGRDAEKRDAVEAEQWRIAARALSLGLNVVLENGFWTRRDRDAYRACGEAVGAKVRIHFLDAPRDELLRRLAVRNAAAAPDTFQVSPEDIDLWTTWFERPTLEELS